MSGTQFSSPEKAREYWRRTYLRTKARRPWALQSYTARSKARYYAVPSTLTPDQWLAILQQSGCRCQKCGIEAANTPQGYLSLDHAKSMGQGGANVASNVAPLCLRCNMSKGDSWWKYGPISPDAYLTHPPKVVRSANAPSVKELRKQRPSLSQLKKRFRLVVTPPTNDTGFSADDLLAGV